MESVAKRLKEQGLNHFMVRRNSLWLYFIAPTAREQHRQAIVKTQEAKKLLDAFFKTHKDITVGTSHVSNDEGIPQSGYPMYSRLIFRTPRGRDYLEKLRSELIRAGIPELGIGECERVLDEEKFYMDTRKERESKRKAYVERYLDELFPKSKKDSPPAISQDAD